MRATSSKQRCPALCIFFFFLISVDKLQDKYFEIVLLGLSLPRDPPKNSGEQVTF